MKVVMDAVQEESLGASVLSLWNETNKIANIWGSLLAEKSIKNITVSELCQAAEINRSTFYNHYGCPADVLREIEISVIEDLTKIWEGHRAGKNWPVNERVEALCTYLLEHKNISKLLFRDSDTNSEFATLLIQATHLQSVYNQIFSYLKRNLSHDSAVASRRYSENTERDRRDYSSRLAPRVVKYGIHLNMVPKIILLTNEKTMYASVTRRTDKLGRIILLAGRAQCNEPFRKGRGANLMGRETKW